MASQELADARAKLDDMHARVSKCEVRGWFELLNRGGKILEFGGLRCRCRESTSTR